MGGSAANPFVTVGQLAYIGGLTRIIQDVPPFMIVEGNPAKVRRVNEIGLQRAGYPPERIEELCEAFKRIYRTQELNRLKVFNEIEAGGTACAEVQYLVQFLRRSMANPFGRHREGLRKG
jgi:UDP-N-acetylglucosamine acyltransferase